MLYQDLRAVFLWKSWYSCSWLVCPFETALCNDNPSSEWQPCMVQQQPYCKVFLLWHYRLCCFCLYACVRITWAFHPEHNNMDDSIPQFLRISKAPAQYSSRTAAAAAVQHHRTSHCLLDGVCHPPRRIPPHQSIYRPGDKKNTSQNNHPIYQRSMLYTPPPGDVMPTNAKYHPRYQLLGDTVRWAKAQNPQVCERTRAYGTCFECGIQTHFHPP